MPSTAFQRRLFKVGLPAILAAALLLILGGWFAISYYSLDSRFGRSKQALNAFAARVTVSGPSALAGLPARIGDFQASDPEPLPHGFLFRADFDNPFDWNGLAYSSEPLPRQVGRDHFEHIDGFWYRLDRN